MRVQNAYFYWCVIQTEVNGVGHRGWVWEGDLPSNDHYNCARNPTHISMRISPGCEQFISRDKVVTFVVDYSKCKRLYWED